MAIKVVFPAGQNSVIVQGLYQWDYGQMLEIECPELGNELMEVHFACPNMTMALPRPCTFSNGVGTVPIPDQCLEQGEALTAWICRIDDKQGHTIKTITMPITKRTKPIRTYEVPEELVDKYTELLVEVREAVNAIKGGEITVARANYALSADKANTAKHAENVSYAPTAGNSQTADYSDKAGAFAMKLVASCTIASGVGTLNATLSGNTPYLVVYESNTNTDFGTGCGALITQIATEMDNSKYWCCPVNHSHAVAISSKSVMIFNGSAMSSPTADTNENGSLKVYTFGNIS